MVWGVCVGAEVILAALARDWSCSQSCAQTAFNALEECGLMPTVFQRSSPWST